MGHTIAAGCQSEAQAHIGIGQRVRVHQDPGVPRGSQPAPPDVQEPRPASGGGRGLLEDLTAGPATSYYPSDPDAVDSQGAPGSLPHWPRWCRLGF